MDARTTDDQPIGPRIVIVGAAGFTNLGDDAILAAMLAELSAAIPAARITVATGDPDSLAVAALPGDSTVTAIQLDDSAIAAALAGSDLLIIGGGGFIYDYDQRISA